MTLQLIEGKRRRNSVPKHLQAVFSEDGTRMLCKKCGQFLPLSEMFPSKMSQAGYANWCMRCTNLWRNYRITSADYDEMLKQQGGGCAICGRPPELRIQGRTRRLTAYLHVDHDHITGKVRALLCDGCNHGIGSFGEDAERLRKAAEYIERWKHAPSDVIGLSVGK